MLRVYRERVLVEALGRDHVGPSLPEGAQVHPSVHKHRITRQSLHEGVGGFSGSPLCVEDVAEVERDDRIRSIYISGTLGAEGRGG
jgi:hypothetical protein